MSDDPFGAAGELQPKFNINFNLRTSLSRPISQPLIIDEPVGLVVFGDSSAVYLAQVADPGAGVYSKLGSVRATTYIHGWSVNSGWLYVLDGVELSAWDLREGKKKETLNLVKVAADVQKANDTLADLQKSIQRVEWATLLEQAEDEWVRLTAQQSAAPPVSEERDRLDALATDYFRMLRALREVTGSAGGAVAARQLVADLRKALAEKRLAAKPWCFSPPLVRKHSFEEPQRAIFIIQGNGTLHACDKALAQPSIKKWTDQAELKLALLELPQAKLIGYIGSSRLRVVDAKTMEEKSTWAPETAPPAGTSHTLTAANKQFWWATDSGVYACEADEAGRLKPSWKSGQPWTTRQVGRINAPPVPFEPRINPNDLFDTMNVRTWIERRTNQSAPLNDGMTTQLLLSDAAGKYKTPPEGTTYIVHGPFERDARSAASSWTHIKPHPTFSLVLLSDSRGASVLCRYPSAGGVSQLIPQWSVAPWLSSIVPYSSIDFALLQGWTTPGIRPLSKPFPDMVARYHSSTAGKTLDQLETTMSITTQGGRKFGDRELRMVCWYGLFDRAFPSSLIFGKAMTEASKKVLEALFNSTQLMSLRERFGPLGPWDYMPGDTVSAEHNVYAHNFMLKEPPVNYDPPWVCKSLTPGSFHSTPPLWYDPWGYNRPGDFVPDQPSPTYLDPFCFNGQLRFPLRAISLDTSFKGRRWAVFTDNDPASLLASTKPPLPPKQLRAEATEPSALVVTADEDRQRTTFQVLPPKQLRITHDAASHTVRNEATAFGSTSRCIVASPLVFLSPGQTFPVAWCVTNADFPAARLRKLATPDSGGTSLWEKFVTDHRAQYGPKDGGKTWQIDLCPLPTDAQPILLLHGYGLPASS